MLGLVLRKLRTTLVFCLNEGKQAWVWKSPPTLLCDLQGYPGLLSHTSHKLPFSFLAGECHCEADRIWQLKCVPQGLRSTMSKILVILVDTDRLTPSCRPWKRKLCLPKHKTNKTAFYKGFCQVPSLFILHFVTLHQKSEYENSFPLFLFHFPFLIKNCPCFIGEKRYVNK